MKTKKTTARRAKEVEAKPVHNPRKLVYVASIVRHGQPHAEGGPTATEKEVFEGDRPLLVRDVLGAAALQLVRRPKWRALIDGNFTGVIVISDADADDATRRLAARFVCSVAGSLTEAEAAVRRVRWIALPANLAVSDVAELAAGEVRLLREEKPDMHPADLVVVFWRNSGSAFGGAPALEIGQQICDAVFTTGVEGIEPFMACDESGGTYFA